MTWSVPSEPLEGQVSQVQDCLKVAFQQRVVGDD